MRKRRDNTLKVKNEFKKHRYFRELCDYLAVNAVDREIITFLTRVTHSYAGQITDTINMSKHHVTSHNPFRLDISERWVYSRLMVLLERGTIEDVSDEVRNPNHRIRYFALTDNFKKVLCSFSGTNRW